MDLEGGSTQGTSGLKQGRASRERANGQTDNTGGTVEGGGTGLCVLLQELPPELNQYLLCVTIIITRYGDSKKDTMLLLHQVK